MFVEFFYRLRDYGVPVSPTNFLQLQRALAIGLITDLNDFYVVARSLMVKRERHFDLYDQIFANYFEGKKIDEAFARSLEDDLQQLLQKWLEDPQFHESLSPDEREKVKGMTPDEVMAYFLERLREQTSRHDGGSRWIGTGGTSPVGHGGEHPGGMRVGGQGRNRSAIKVAMDRRYVDYSQDTPLTAEQIGEALRALRHLVPMGPRDEINVEKTIYETVRQAGEIELVFDRRLRDKLSVFLFIDNGGWSMNPFVERTRALFTHARSNFKRLQTYFFHNCIYDTVWEDTRRFYKPVPLEDILRAEPETRLIIMGDASMAPWELLHPRGAIDVTTRQRRSGLECLRDLAERFPKHVWINPIHSNRWSWAEGAHTIESINEIFPMLDLTLSGIEKAVELLKGK
ncbi:MAG: hypothetical protein P9L99_15035 [Candidatus Lernaella stagnicola]|nr:hypothetical protein [Candidatus Lernaella stagnicola]